MAKVLSEGAKRLLKAFEKAKKSAEAAEKMRKVPSILHPTPRPKAGESYLTAKRRIPGRGARVVFLIIAPIAV